MSIYGFMIREGKEITGSQNDRGWKGPMEVIWCNHLAQAGPVVQHCVQTAFEHPQGWRQICDAFKTKFMTLLSFITYPYHEFS